MNIRLYHAKILTMEKDRPVFQGEIWVKNDKIAYLAEEQKIKEELSKGLPPISWDLQIDCEGNLLMPGFKNAHTHSAMTLLRSYADDMPLDRWLREKIFPAEEKLTKEDAYDLTRLAVLEYLTSGITSIFDMYLYPDATGQACMDMGMRCVLTSGMNDFTSDIAQMEQEYLKWNRKHSLISYQLGFHAEYTTSKERLYELSRLAHKYRAPVYTHLAETQKEVEECRQRYGMTPAVFLDSMGLFDFGGGGYHCVYMSNEDVELFRRRGLYVVTNPSSNLKLASGIAPISTYLKQKIPVAIGTDGPASNNCLDMFREMFLVSGLSKIREQDAAVVSAGEVLHMATVNGARAMQLGRADILAKGKYADLIMIDLKQPNMQPIRNIPANLVYSGSKLNVAMTMIGGKVLYYRGQYNVGDSVENIYQRCEQIARRIFCS